MCIALARMEELMLLHGRILPPGAQNELRFMYLVWRSGHDKLCQEALSKSVCRWVLRPKHHFTEHVLLDCGSLNPRYASNYISEDFIRRVKQLASKSHPAYLSAHVAFKYALQVCLQWRR